MQALADAEWPTERKVCAIITRESDAEGIANVKTLRKEFRGSFAEFIHILDPLEPGIVIGKSSAMAFGGRYLYRLLVPPQPPLSFPFFFFFLLKSWLTGELQQQLVVDDDGGRASSSRRRRVADDDDDDDDDEAAASRVDDDDDDDD